MDHNIISTTTSLCVIQVSARLDLVVSPATFRNWYVSCAVQACTTTITPSIFEIIKRRFLTVRRHNNIIYNIHNIPIYYDIYYFAYCMYNVRVTTGCPRELPRKDDITINNIIINRRKCSVYRYIKTYAIYTYTYTMLHIRIIIIYIYKK